jgi:glycosyltransferase involved in cell wall biosynthesis
LENINNNLRIGFIGRNYAHKNTRIFPEIINILHQKHGIHCNIYVTFTDQEWNECDEVFRSLVFNVGPLFVAQCPNFYRAMNAIIFPSLLECFSATPLEAMAMERPLFASDRQFNHDICAEHAYYFDPMNPEDAAEKISSNIEYSPERIKRAREHALSFSNARERAKKYLDLLATSADNSE